MKLRYKIPHKVTLRMVGTLFVATCSCNEWSQQANLKATHPFRWPFADETEWNRAFNELLEQGHRHATDHVMDSNGFQRKTFATGGPVGGKSTQKAG